MTILSMDNQMVDQQERNKMRSRSVAVSLSTDISGCEMQSSNVMPGEVFEIRHKNGRHVAIACDVRILPIMPKL